MPEYRVEFPGGDAWKISIKGKKGKEALKAAHARATAARAANGEIEPVAFEDCAEASRADATTPDPQLQLERHALRRAVRAAVDKLPDHYREVIVLHNLEGLSLAQIADVLEIPEGTVKSRRAKALSKLRHLLHEQEVGTDEL